MQHLKGFGLENFRVFKDYTWFDFAPITLLIGPNSSGKSSLIKALLLLKDSNINLSIKANYPEISSIKFYEKPSLKFDNPLLNLMGIENILNKKSNNSLPFYFLINDLFFKQYLFLEIEFSGENKYFYKLLFKNGKVLLKLDWMHTIYFDVKLFFEMIKEEHNIDINVIKEKLDNKALNQTEVEALNYFLSFDKKIYESQINNTEKEVSLLEKGNLSPKNTKILQEIDDEELRQLTSYEMIYSECIEKEGLGGLKKFLEYNSLPTEIAIQFYNLINLANINSMVQNIKNKINYLPSIKGFQRRSFRINEDDILNQVIKGLQQTEEKNEFLRKWEKEFRLEGKINWQTDTKLGVSYLDLNEKSLVDLGFGISQLVAILLSIYKYSKGENEKFNLVDFINNIDNKFNEIMIFEEPEANLHPAYQSKLADLFSQSMQSFSLQFIIETHSEYMVRKFQYLVAKGEMKKEDIVIYYFNDPNNIPAGEPQVKKIEILEDGSLSDDFGGGFFDEAANWELELLRLKKNKIRQN